jgi:hypothetical protein
MVKLSASKTGNVIYIHNLSLKLIWLKLAVNVSSVGSTRKFEETFAVADECYILVLRTRSVVLPPFSQLEFPVSCYNTQPEKTLLNCYTVLHNEAIPLVHIQGRKCDSWSSSLKVMFRIEWRITQWPNCHMFWDMWSFYCFFFVCFCSSLTEYNSVTYTYSFRTMWSWFRIAFWAWKHMWYNSVFVLSCVCVDVLQLTGFLSKCL